MGPLLLEAPLLFDGETAALTHRWMRSAWGNRWSAQECGRERKTHALGNGIHRADDSRRNRIKTGGPATATGLTAPVNRRRESCSARTMMSAAGSPGGR